MRSVARPRSSTISNPTCFPAEGGRRPELIQQREQAVFQASRQNASFARILERHRPASVNDKTGLLIDTQGSGVIERRCVQPEALDRPRCVLGQTWGAPHASLLVEAGFDESVIERLSDAGHEVERLAERYADCMGHAGAVVLHPAGTLEGAHDPRADGGAAGA